MSEENKAIMHRFYEEFVNPGNPEVADEIIAAECPFHFGGNFMGTGPEAFKQTLQMMRSAFPDLRLTIEEMVAEGDAVAERLTGRGTHQGAFMGIAGTGERVEFEAIAIFHVAEGKIVEGRGMPDMLGMLQQIGAVPPLQRAP